MTSKEKVLKAQIKELERLVEIKDEVIKELESLISPSAGIQWNTTGNARTISGGPMPTKMGGSTNWTYLKAPFTFTGSGIDTDNSKYYTPGLDISGNKISIT